MSIIKNSAAPERIPTYDGSDQSTHPSVVHFDSPWNGFLYWMAMTPYPNNNDGYEDPSILASNDGKNWIVPSGVVTPLVSAPVPGHNCDVELVYEPEQDELRLYYVEADDIVQSWVKLLRSRDGVHWTGPEVVIHDPARKYGILSPAIQRMKDGSWQMWYVDTGNTGYICQENVIRTRTSADGIVWGEESTEALTQPGYQIWHLTVWKDPGAEMLHAIYPAYPNGTNCDYCKLFYARKAVGGDWITFDSPIMEQGEAGAWDDFCLYRVAFLLEKENDLLRLWYGGKRRADANWGIGYTESIYSMMLDALKNKMTISDKVKNRYVGGYPVIGIRPTIDGRRGPLKVRESLEEQTMSMARAAQKLFEDNICYSNGEPVRVVIADTTIGRVAEAAACADKFRKAGVDITLTVTPCWCYGSETMDMDPMTIKGVWGFNGTERPGAVYLASVLASHAQKGLPAFGIYGHDVQDIDEVADIPDDVREKLLRFGRAAVAVATMRGKSYLQIGSICMGIGGSIIDTDFIESYLGMRVESVDEVEIIRRMSEGIYDGAEVAKAHEWIKANCLEGWDKNPGFVKASPEKKAEQWEFLAKMYCIIKDLMNGNPNLPEGKEEEMVGHNAIAAGFQGQRQWTDFYPNCDFPEALLNSTFDYNGAREPYILATENDVLNGLGMLFIKLLTNRAVMFSDVRTYWSLEAVKRASGYDMDGKALENGGIIHLINSGATALDACGLCRDESGEPVMKRWWEVTEEDIQTMMESVTWPAADYGYFRGGGFSSSFTTRAEMPATMIRLNLVKGLGPVLQIAEGWTVRLPDDVTDTLMRRTDPTWPCTWFTPRCDGKEGPFKAAYDVMNNWGANHGAIGYGHIGADLITLCSMLRIPVCMHNIPEADIFRPAVWNAFGMDKEGQDYRACAAYGPLYK